MATGFSVDVAYRYVLAVCLEAFDASDYKKILLQSYAYMVNQSDYSGSFMTSPSLFLSSTVTNLDVLFYFSIFYFFSHSISSIP